MFLYTNFLSSYPLSVHMANDEFISYETFTSHKLNTKQYNKILYAVYTFYLDVF